MNEWQAYELGAAAYSEIGEDDPAWRQRQRQYFCDLLQGSTVIDIGCGPGYDSAAFAALGLSTLALDGSPAMLQHCRANSPSTAVFQQDFRAPLPTTVDGIWCMFALLHLPPDEIATCLSTWRKSISPGGPIALGLVESPRVRERQVNDWLGVESFVCQFHYHPSEQLQCLLPECGFTLQAVRNETPACYRGGHYDEIQLRAYVLFATATPTVQGVTDIDGRQPAAFRMPNK